MSAIWSVSAALTILGSIAAALADNEWSGIPQIYNDLRHIDIVELALIAGIDPAGVDDAGDGRNPSVLR
jgi:hypothetical protein